MTFASSYQRLGFRNLILLGLCLFVLACSDSQRTEPTLDPVEFCANIGPAPNSKNDATSDAYIDKQSIDICEKVKQLTFNHVSLKVDVTRLNISANDSIIRKCDDSNQNISLAPIGTKYKYFIREANVNSDCLKLIKETVGYKPAQNDQEQYDLTPERSLFVYDNLLIIDALPNFRENADYYSFPIFMISNEKEITIHCLALEEAGINTDLPDEILKFDCIGRL